MMSIVLHQSPLHEWLLSVFLIIPYLQISGKVERNDKVPMESRGTKKLRVKLVTLDASRLWGQGPRDPKCHWWKTMRDMALK